MLESTDDEMLMSIYEKMREAGQRVLENVDQQFSDLWLKASPTGVDREPREC
jgi:hypothetical protein